MAGHITSSIHKSLDGLRVTSYSQWDAEASRALFENEAALAESLAWFAPLTASRAGLPPLPRDYPLRAARLTPRCRA
jgi:hypothetical protein